ncbi:hypothetical protein PHLGIDRAFT_114372 [Phlebiopsis gigantea 11061_1 CR5-6]|uniref:Uncharacterized protein n=1 Tax=Phlebiopsis gigantea (strain 11061_1 CR5-6) TaxID=745531 RepID=A0A0C3S5W6_PHLG1|nr:hypothetical protein PHLGIDRAFT_114372 [Phlebiopsis gigantea 11061_1 CR5-6]
MSNTTATLPSGHDFLTRVALPGREASGLIVLVATSSVSAAAVVALLAAIALSAWNTRRSVNPHMFVRSHAAAYLVSLLVCDLFQAVGSLMNARWVADRAVEFGPFCQAQGVMKQIADVGTAVWALVIAVHTFWVLFLKWDLRRHVLIATMVFNWAAIGTFVIAGPATASVKENGPFYGISGYWCWIAEGYPVARIVLDYLFMFVSAGLSFVLYILVFCRIRGNLLVAGRRVRLRLHRSTDSSRGLSADDQTIAVTKQMLLYPVAYTIIILPIAVCRFAAWSGAEVPFAATIFTDSLYLLSGLVNVLLFCLTRRVLPRHSVVTHRFRASEDEEPDFESAGPASPVAAGSYLAETDAYGDEKVFKRVESPDSDADADALPPPRAIADADAARSPEIGGAPMAYPQSPLSAGGGGPVSPPPLRSAALRSNLGIQ